MRLHGSLPPLECPQAGCPCTFSSAIKLGNHLKQHNASRSKPYPATGANQIPAAKSAPSGESFPNLHDPKQAPSNYPSMQSTFDSAAARLDHIVIPAKSSFVSTADSRGRAFQCPDVRCGRRFNRKYTLTEHMKTHTGERPHVCRARSCGKRFSTSGNLLRHMRLHGAIQPVECPMKGCPCTFLSDTKLAKHMKSHYAPRTHACKVSGCGKAFSTTGNLNRHLKNQHTQLEREERMSSICTSPASIPCHTPATQKCDTPTRESPTGIDQECLVGAWQLTSSDSYMESDSDSQSELDSEESLIPFSFGEACTTPWSSEMLDILSQMLLE
ncbi:hypothetical protein BBJ28_00004296 [Nothophytophthora sp. Chile5]|nr:hypothetical protein BBJ28_00004296 [Nothophytophthora sp. Chile5]